jgi:hypothetical protein
MSDSRICELCGRSSAAGATSCAHCGCSLTHFDSAYVSGFDATDPLILNFGFRSADIETSNFKAAEAAFLSGQSSSTAAFDLGYKRESVLENGDAYYFPVGWVGCSGHLVTKNPLRLISFGSYIGPGAHIWAHYQGISMAPLGKDRQNTLKILSISDLANTLRVLKTFLNPKWVDQELSVRLSSLPTELKEVDLYFGIRDLLEAQDNDWFRFKVL